MSCNFIYYATDTDTDDSDTVTLRAFMRVYHYFIYLFINLFKHMHSVPNYL